MTKEPEILHRGIIEQHRGIIEQLHRISGGRPEVRPPVVSGSEEIPQRAVVPEEREAKVQSIPRRQVILTRETGHVEEVQPLSVSAPAEEAKKNYLATRDEVGGVNWGLALRMMLKLTHPGRNAETPMEQIENLVPDLSAALMTNFVVERPVSDIGASLPMTLTSSQREAILSALKFTLSASEYHDPGSSDSGIPSLKAKGQREDVEIVLQTLRGLYIRGLASYQDGEGGEELRPGYEADFLGEAIRPEEGGKIEAYLRVKKGKLALISPVANDALLTSQLIPPKMQATIKSRLAGEKTMAEALRQDWDAFRKEEEEEAPQVFLEAAKFSLMNRFCLYRGLLAGDGDMGQIWLYAGAMLDTIQAHRRHLLDKMKNGERSLMEGRLEALTAYEQMVKELEEACGQALGDPCFELDVEQLSNLDSQPLDPVEVNGSFKRTFATRLLEAAWPSGFQRRQVVEGALEPKRFVVHDVAEPAKVSAAELVIRALTRLQEDTAGQLLASGDLGIAFGKMKEALGRVCQDLGLEDNPEAQQEALGKVIVKHPSAADGGVPVQVFFDAALNLAQEQGAFNQFGHLDFPAWAFAVSSFLGPHLRKIKAALPKERGRKYAGLVRLAPESARLSIIPAITKTVEKEYQLPTTLPEVKTREGIRLTAHEAFTRLRQHFTGQEKLLLFLTGAFDQIRRFTEPDCGEPLLDRPKKRASMKPNIWLGGSAGTGKTEAFEIVGREMEVRVVLVPVDGLTVRGIVGDHPENLLLEANREFLIKYGKELGITTIEEAINAMEKGVLIVFDEAAGLTGKGGKGRRVDEEHLDPEAKRRELRKLLEPGPLSHRLAEVISGETIVYGTMNLEKVIFALAASLSERERELNTAFDFQRGQIYGASENPGITIDGPEALGRIVPPDFARRLPSVCTTTPLTEKILKDTWLSPYNSRSPRNRFMEEDFQKLLEEVGDSGTVTFKSEADELIISEAARNLNLGYTALAIEEMALVRLLSRIQGMGFRLGGRELVITKELARAAVVYKDLDLVAKILEEAIARDLNLTASGFVKLLSEVYKTQRGIHQ